MKTRLIFAAMLLMAFGSVKAQDTVTEAPKTNEKLFNAVVVSRTGNVLIKQDSTCSVVYSDLNKGNSYQTEGNVLVLSSYIDAYVTMEELNDLTISGAGDVGSVGQLHGGNLTVKISGAGDAILDVDYDTIRVEISGAGDVTLHGKCKVLYVDLSGAGDLNLQGMDIGEWHSNTSGSGRVRTKAEDHWHSRKYPKKRTLLFDPNWGGFEAGLNMLLGPGSTGNFEGEYVFLEQRPLRSWVFNFNIADVGLAFDYRHTAGIYTGIGLGWNNYSFNNPVRLVKGEKYLEAEWIDPTEASVKNSKLGVLYLQAPLMVEVRPLRHFYIAAGVTGGLRIDTWTKLKFHDGDKYKTHSDYYVNPFKLDASLRVGGNDLGFFANFNLLPTFDEHHAPACHTVSFGFSIIF